MTTGKDMVFIQVEVGAISASSDLARATGMSEDAALAGLVRFWHCCIRDHRRIEEFQHVSEESLAALVESSWGRKITPTTLELLGFIRRVDGPNPWRIRGLTRYIEAEKRRTAVFEARSNAGSASVRSRFEKYGSAQPVRRTKLEQPSNKTRTKPEQAPNLDGRRETGDERLDTEKKPASRPQNEFAEMLFDAFKEEMGSTYKHSKEDFIGLAGILKAETRDEVMLRWRRGLRKKRDTGYGPATIAQLASGKFWNDLAVERQYAGTKVQQRAKVAHF